MQACPAGAGGKYGAFLHTNPGQPQPIKHKTDMGMNNEQLQELADMVAAKVTITAKEVLTSQEAARYMGISKSYLYKLTMRQEIPHYKPSGKMCYFNRHELDGWMQKNRINTAAEAAQQAHGHCMKNRRAI